MKTEALKLADQLDGLNSCEPVIIKACETMIRRLVEELDKLESNFKDDEPMKICNLINETYQVIKNDEVFYQGSLERCESFIQVFEGN